MKRSFRDTERGHRVAANINGLRLGFEKPLRDRWNGIKVSFPAGPILALSVANSTARRSAKFEPFSKKGTETPQEINCGFFRSAGYQHKSMATIESGSSPYLCFNLTIRFDQSRSFGFLGTVDPQFSTFLIRLGTSLSLAPAEVETSK